MIWTSLLKTKTQLTLCCIKQIFWLLTELCGGVPSHTGVSVKTDVHLFLSVTQKKSRRWIHVQPLFIARFSWREILHKSVSALHQGEEEKKPKKDKTCIFTINASLLPLIHYVHISLVYYDSSYRMKPLHALHFSSTGNYSAFKIKNKKGTGWTTFTQQNRIKVRMKIINIGSQKYSLNIWTHPSHMPWGNTLHTKKKVQLLKNKKQENSLLMDVYK